jgi:hypothetical protein
MVIALGGGGQYGHPSTSASSGDPNPTFRLGRIHTLWLFAERRTDTSLTPAEPAHEVRHQR